MNMGLPNAFRRRHFLKGAGALIVGFSLANALRPDDAAAMEIGPYGPPEDQIDSWIAIGEDGRATLVELASKRLNAPADQLITADGVVSVRNTPARKVTYGELVGGKQFNVKVTGKTKTKEPKDYRIVGKSVPRWDIPEKVFGSFTYMQDVKVAGMLHGRVVRPPAHGASVVAIDESSVARIPGLIKVVRVSDLVGVVCRREEQAIAAAQALKVTWSNWAALPDMKDLHSTLRSLPEFSQGYPKDAPGGMLAKSGDVEAGLGKAVKVLKATYLSPFNHH